MVVLRFMGSIQINVYFIGEFLSNFTPKKYDFNPYQGFFIEKMAQICQILKGKKFQITKNL